MPGLPSLAVSSTKSWVNVAFTQRRPDAGVSFDVQVSSHSHVSLEQEYVSGGDLKLGPTGRVWVWIQFAQSLLGGSDVS